MPTFRAPAFFLARVSSLICAIPLPHVVETLRPLSLRPLAGAPDFLSGLSIVRGAPVPVVDLAVLIGQARAAAPARWVTLRVGERPLALAVEKVLGIRELDDSTLDSLPPLLREAAPGLIQAIGRLDSELLVVLEASRILPEEQWAALAGAGSPG